MVWSIETDDFHGKCGERFALLSTLNKGLEHDEVTSTTTNAPTTISTSTHHPESTTTTEEGTTSIWASTSTTTEDPGPIKCVETGYFRHPEDCSKFYFCEGATLHTFQCPAGLYFDLSILSCNYPERVEC